CARTPIYDGHYFDDW
nr:immunoglobulin heavy chain junction region [Mus musculus]